MRRANPTVSAFEGITREDYPGVFLDFDSDGILNVDDPHPLEAGDTDTVEEVRLSDEIAALIEARERFTDVLTDVMDRLRELAPGALVMGRVKTPLSVINKLRRKRLSQPFKTARDGDTYTVGLTDMAGCLAVLPDYAGVAALVRQVQNGMLGLVREHEDFYAHPNAGYRAHHFIIEHDGMPVEVQVKTKRLKRLSEASHTVYKHGALDGDGMDRMAALADRADRGDRAAAREFDGLSGHALESAVSLRSNPAPAPASKAAKQTRRRAVLLELAALYAGLVRDGRFDPALREPVETTFSKLAKAFGVAGRDLGLDGLPARTGAGDDGTGSDEPATGSESADRALGDVDLRAFAPVRLTRSERRAANEAALSILNKPDEAVTELDRKALRLYTGAGGLGAGERGDELSGVLNEHYTSYPVVTAIWSMLAALGFKAGNVLEPGAGVGNFIGLRPAGVDAVMVEKSPVSSRIAKLLYPTQTVVQSDLGRWGHLVVDKAWPGGERWATDFNLTAAIGNVPFGDYSIAGNDDPLARFGGDSTRIHDYIILKALDVLAPGGPLAIITSTGTADKLNESIRAAMLTRGALVAVWRLPSGTFEANADTEITTDLLVMQRRPNADVHRLAALGDLSRLSNEALVERGLTQAEIDFLRVETRRETVRGSEYDVRLNRYFAQRPGQVLGTLEAGHGQQFVSRYGARGDFDAAAAARLAAPVELPYALPSGSSGRGERLPLWKRDAGTPLATREGHVDPAGAVVYAGKPDTPGFYEKGARLYRPITVPAASKAVVRSALGILDAFSRYTTALARDGAGGPGAATLGLRVEVTRLVTRHVETFGLFADDDRLRDALRYDPRLFKLQVMVKAHDRGDVTFAGLPGTYRFADLLRADKLYSSEYEGTLDNADDVREVAAYARGAGEPVTVDGLLPFYRGGTATRDEVIEAVKKLDGDEWFFDPKRNEWTHRYDYLTGDLWPKIDAATSAALEGNVTALTAALPPQVTLFEIAASPSHVWSWMPVEAVTEWLRDVLGYRRMSLSLYRVAAGIGGRTADLEAHDGYKKQSGRGGSPVDTQKGWGGEPYRSIVETLINGGSFPTYVPDAQGGRSGVKLDDATDAQKEEAKRLQAANHDRMLRQIPADFTEWLRLNAPQELRERVESAFNRRYNSFALPPFDGRTFRVRGMSDTFYGIKGFTVFRHNLRAAEMALWNGAFGNAHDVGAGKTVATILAVMAGKQRGMWNKPMLVVPGKVIEKWAQEISMLFPGASVLNLRLSGRAKSREIALAQLYDWDFILVPDHAFARFNMHPDREAFYLERRIDGFRRLVEDYVIEAKAGGASVSKRERNRIEKLVAKLETQLADLRKKRPAAEDVFFDEIGVDCLVFDEAHFYKNALGSPKASELGIAAASPSKRAENALAKADHIRAFRGDGKGVIALTATPVVNSPIEVYHMLRLVSPETLDAYGVADLDDFIELFVRSGLREVRRMTGKYASKLVVTGYDNIPEMQRLIGSLMDVKSYDQLRQFYIDYPEYGPDGKPVEPFRRPALRREHDLIEPSEVHDLLFEDIKLRAEEIMECYKDPDCEPAGLEDNFLVLTRDGAAISTDLRLYDPTVLDFTGPSAKVARLAEAVATVYKTGNPIRLNPPAPSSGFRDAPLDGAGGAGVVLADDGDDWRDNPAEAVPPAQLVFCDFVTTQAKESFHAAIKAAIVARGVPAAQVCIINGSVVGVNADGTDHAVRASEDREELKKQAQDDFNEGRYRVIIGNKTIAEGMNLNAATSHVHHLDVPYTPGEITQRDGRAVRQGNKYAEVVVTHYLMARSFDEHRLRLVAKKADWIDQLFYGTARSQDADEGDGSLSYEDMMAAVTDDPRIAEYFTTLSRIRRAIPLISQLDAQTQKLTRSASEAERVALSLESQMEVGTERLARVQALTLPASGADALANGTIAFNARDGYSDTPTKGYGDEATHNNVPVTLYNVPLRLSVTEPRVFTSYEVKLGVAANKSSEGVKYLVRIDGPLNRNGGRMAPRSEYDRFWGAGYWSELAGTSGWVELATEAEVAAAAGVDLDAEKAKKQRVYDADKGEYVEAPVDWLTAKAPILNPSAWWPVVKPVLADLLLAFEKRWVDRFAFTVRQGKAQLDRARGDVDRFNADVKRVSGDRDAAKVRYAADVARAEELQPIVAELTVNEYDSREELAEVLFDAREQMIADGELVVAEGTARTAAELIASARSVDPDADDALAEPGVPEPRVNPAGLCFSVLGYVDRITVEGGPTYTDRAGGTLLVWVPDLGRILAVPSERARTARADAAGRDGGRDAALAAYEEWLHDEADGHALALDLPAAALDARLPASGRIGTGEGIWYRSDKRMEAGDRAGKLNGYHHSFHRGRRAVHELHYPDGGSPVVAVSGIQINGRGILN